MADEYRPPGIDHEAGLFIPMVSQLQNRGHVDVERTCHALRSASMQCEYGHLSLKIREARISSAS